MSDIEEYEEDEIDITAFDWINEKVDEEVTRLTAEGLKPLKMTPKNFGIVRQGETKNDPVINRIEMNTRFDFGQRIKQIMISESQPYPNKPGFNYVHVLLLTDNVQMPLIVPYLYPAEVEVSVETKKKTRKNDLKEWLLVNAKGLRARHSISEYHAM